MNNYKNDLDAIDDMITQLANDDGSVRERARLALVARGQIAVTSLTKALHSKSEQMRWEAAKSLVSIADPEAVPSLIKALEDEIFDIRWLAAEALIAIGRKSIEPLLRALIDHSKELFLLEGSHHVITYIIANDPERKDLAEILNPVEKALDGAAPGIAVPIAAQVALRKMNQLI